MVLNSDPKHFASTELTAAINLRQKRLSQWRSMVDDYHGNAYDGGQGEDRQENTAFEVVAGLNPQIVFQNPRVKLSSSRPEYQPLRVQGLEYAVNRWIRDTQPRQLYEELCTDFMFGFGVCLTKPARHNVRTERKEGDEFDDPIHRPTTERIDPNEFVSDPKSRSFRAARWMGHPVTMDLDEMEKLSADDGWDKGAIAELSEGQGAEARHDNYARAENLERKSVTFYELWFPFETADDDKGGPEKGYNGVWRTMTPDGKKLREDRAAFVPRWGPYSFFGAYSVPSQQHPLGLVPAMRGLDDQLNRTAEANVEAIERHKELVMVEESDPDLADKVEGSPTGSVVTAKTTDIKNNVVPLRLGGATREGMEGESILRDRRDRAIGLQDAQRGEVSGVGTATEQVIAQRASSIRVAHLQQKFQIDGVQQHLRTVAWYLDADDRTVMYLGPQAAQVFGKDPVYVGGMYEGANERYSKEFPQRSQDEPMEDDGWRLDDFDLLEVELEPYSMVRADDPSLQARAMQGLQIAAQVAPLVVQAPWMDWKQILDRIGDSMNWPEFGSSILNEGLAAGVANQMLQAQVVEPQPNVRGRMAQDVKPRGDQRIPSQGNPFGVAVGA